MTGVSLSAGVVPNPARQLDTAQRAHPQLAENQVNRRAQHLGRRISGTFAGDDPITGLPQPLRQHSKRAAVRLNDQQSGGAGAMAGRRGLLTLHAATLIGYG